MVKRQPPNITGDLAADNRRFGNTQITNNARKDP
jgi:hypothetical protein